MDISKNNVVVGDFNDDLLKDNKYYLKDVLLINPCPAEVFRIYPGSAGQGLIIFKM